MGFALPAAMGARIACPNDEIWVIAGDGGFQMTAAELSTCAQENLKLNVAIINNGYLGMVRQWQELFWDKRYSHVEMGQWPDFVKLAEAYGCVGLRCERPEDIDATIKKAMEINDVPVVVDFVVHRDAMVWPMVPAGVSNDAIQVAKDTAPQWDREDDEADEQPEEGSRR